jgi:hypothetical protein
VVGRFQQPQRGLAVTEPAHAEFVRQRIRHVAEHRNAGHQRSGKAELPRDVVAVNPVFTVMRMVDGDRLVQRHRLTPFEWGGDRTKRNDPMLRQIRYTAALSCARSFVSLARAFVRCS